MRAHYLALIAAFAALVGGLVLLQPPSTTKAVGILNTDIPGLANYRDDLVHYATITRPDNRTRDLYITPGAGAVVAANSTARLPDQTVIVIEAHQVRGGDRTGLTGNIHVAVKSDYWQPGDYQTDERAGRWNYFSFDPETGQISDESVFACFDCHANNSQIDFMFSREMLADYGATGTLQDTFCNRPGRSPCR